MENDNLESFVAELHRKATASKDVLTIDAIHDRVVRIEAKLTQMSTLLNAIAMRQGIVTPAIMDERAIKRWSKEQDEHMAKVKPPRIAEAQYHPLVSKDDQ